MSSRDRAPRFQNLASQKGRAIATCACLGIALLVAGCARFTYNETPSAVPYIAPSPTSSSPANDTVIPTLAPTPTLIPEGPRILRMNPSVVALAVGETALVEVWLDNAEQLHSIELHVSFDPGYVLVEDADLDAEGVQIGAGVMPVPAQVTQNEVDNDAGLVVYHVAKDPAGLGSRSGTVASFTVRAVAEGGSPLRFNVANLLDAEGQPLAADQINGLVIIGAGDGAPTPAAEAPPTQTPAPSPVPASPATTTGIYYTVQPGENLFRIALRYGTTVDAIVAANDLPDRGAVQAGQTLLIPVSPSAGTTTYVVQPGDTVYSIARRFGMTVEALVALNGIDPSYAIKVGQTLVIVP